MNSRILSMQHFSPLLEETILVAELCQRDTAAFNRLYNRYSGALYGVLVRIIKREEWAEEVLSDLFLKINDNILAYDSSKGRLFTWMVTIARRMGIDKLRSSEAQRTKKNIQDTGVFYEMDRAYSEIPVDGIGLQTLLSKLTQQQRFVIDLVYFKGFTHSEVSEESGIPLGTVKTHLRIAFQTLRTCLSNDIFHIRKTLVQ